MQGSARTTWRAGWHCRCMRALIRGKYAHKLDVVQFTVTVKIELFEHGLGLRWRQFQAERREHCAKIGEPKRVGALTPSAKDAAHINASFKSQCVADVPRPTPAAGLDAIEEAGRDAMRCRSAAHKGECSLGHCVVVCAVDAARQRRQQPLQHRRELGMRRVVHICRQRTIALSVARNRTAPAQM